MRIGDGATGLSSSDDPFLPTDNVIPENTEEK